MKSKLNKKFIISLPSLINKKTVFRYYHNSMANSKRRWFFDNNSATFKKNLYLSNMLSFSLLLICPTHEK